MELGRNKYPKEKREVTSRVDPANWEFKEVERERERGIERERKREREINREREGRRKGKRERE